MRTTFNKSLLAVSVAAAVLAAAPAYATNGYFSDGYGAKSRGMGGSAMSVAQETGSILQNPANAVGLGDRMDVALGLFSPRRGVDIAGNGVLDQNNKSERNAFFIPFFGQSYTINDSSSWAFTISALGGMNTDYGDHPFAGFGASGSMGIDLKQVQIGGTYAKKLGDSLSVGVTLGLVAQEFQAKGLAIFTNLDGFGTSLTLDNANFTDNGKSRSTGIGINIGATYDLGSGITVGAQYAPETDMSEFDEYAGLFAEKGNFDIPSHYSLGVAWQASKDVLLSFDYRRINYTDVPAIANDAQRLTEGASSCLGTGGGSSLNTSCLGGSDGAGFGWSDQDVFKFGVAVTQDSGMVYRAGWNHGNSPIDSEDAVLNIIAPGVTEDHLTLGLTKPLSTDSEITIDFIRTFSNTVSGPVPIAFDGDGNGANGAGTSSLTMSQYFMELNYAKRF